MKRWLYGYRSVPGDPAGDGSFRMQPPVQVLGTELTKAVRGSTGVAHEDDVVPVAMPFA